MSADGPGDVLYHGGVAGLHRGGELLPPTVTGTRRAKAGLGRRDRVYLTPSLEVARFAAAYYPDGDIYEASPLGTPEPDPECRPGSSWMVPAARVAAVIQRHVPMLYHGGVPGLDFGSWLLPPVVTGRSNCEGCRRERVYVTPDLQFARSFAARYSLQGGGDIYSVSLVGALEPDDEEWSPGSSWMVPAARVAAVIERCVPMKLRDRCPPIAPTALLRRRRDPR